MSTPNILGNTADNNILVKKTCARPYAIVTHCAIWNKRHHHCFVVGSHVSLFSPKLRIQILPGWPIVYFTSQRSTSSPGRHTSALCGQLATESACCVFFLAPRKSKYIPVFSLPLCARTLTFVCRFCCAGDRQEEKECQGRHGRQAYPARRRVLQLFDRPPAPGHRTRLGKENVVRARKIDDECSGAYWPWGGVTSAQYSLLHSCGKHA